MRLVGKTNYHPLYPAPPSCHCVLLPIRSLFDLQISETSYFLISGRYVAMDTVARIHIFYAFSLLAIHGQLEVVFNKMVHCKLFYRPLSDILLVQ